MKNAPSAVVAMPTGGFSNNLKCTLSAMREARRLDLPLKIACDDIVSVFDGFEAISVVDVDGSMRQVNTWRFIVYEDDPLPRGFAQRLESRGFVDADPDRRNLDFEYQRIPLEMQRVYLDLIKSLPVRPLLRQEVAQFESTYFDTETVSLHMRTWMTDHWDKAPKRHQLYFDLKRYHEVIATNENLFVCSDNAVALHRLEDEYGSRIVRYPHTDKFTTTEIAFIELMLLSRNSQIFGSSLSTFTEMAWWLGDCSAEITLFGKN